MGSKILILEDEPAIADIITYPLETEGFSPIWCSTCTEARKILRETAIRLLVLDIGLPDGNGFEFCKEIRKTMDLPIIFLTARKEEIDRVLGLELGGDDYVPKPFSPRELVSRIKAVLRRIGDKTTVPDPTPFKVNEQAQKIYFFEKEIELSKYEYGILKTLISRPDWIFSRERLMTLVWEEPGSAMDRTVDAHIKSIRQKLKNLHPEKDPIITHRGMGYSLQ